MTAHILSGTLDELKEDFEHELLDGSETIDDTIDAEHVALVVDDGVDFKETSRIFTALTRIDEKFFELKYIPPTPAIPPFPGWTEVDSNSIITVDDPALLDALWTINGVFQQNATPHAAYVDAGSLFWTGDFEIRYVVNINYAGTTATIDNYIGLCEDLTVPNLWLLQNKDTLTASSFHVAGVISAQKAQEFRNGSANNLSGGFGMGNQDGVDMYVKFRRVGGDMLIDSYINDPTFTDPADDSVSKALNGVDPYQYLFAFQAANAGGNANFDGTIKIISVTPSPWS